MVIKNYKELCKVLEIEVCGGNSKIKQINELERFVSYHKQGYKFVIDEVFDKPKDYIENRGAQKSKYKLPLEKKVLTLLQKSKHCQFCLPKFILCEELDLINFNYRYYNYNHRNLIEVLGVRGFDVEDFYDCTNSNLTYTVMKTLDSLVNKKLILYQKVLVGRDSNSSNCYEISDKDVIKKVLTIQNIAMKSLKCESMGEVGYKNLYPQYNRLVNKELRENVGLSYVFDAYKVTSTKKIVEKAMLEHYNEINIDAINEDFLEKTRVNISKRHLRALDERVEMRNDTKARREKGITDEDDYIDFDMAEAMKDVNKNTRTIYRSLKDYESNSMVVADATIRNTSEIILDED